MKNIKDMVKDGKKVRFVQYKHNQLWYETEDGFRFPVDISDTGDGTFYAEDKAILFMRYIRKALEAEKSEGGPPDEDQLAVDKFRKDLVEAMVDAARVCKCECHQPGKQILHIAPCC